MKITVGQVFIAKKPPFDLYKVMRVQPYSIILIRSSNKLAYRVKTSAILREFELHPYCNSPLHKVINEI